MGLIDKGFQILVERLMLAILQTGALTIRDVDGSIGEKEKPFLYSSGWRGPLYAQIKGIVGWKRLLRTMCSLLAVKIAATVPDVEAIAGNVTGGVSFGLLVSEYLELFLMRVITFTYIRDLRKAGGHKELITGIKNNPSTPPKTMFVDIEELVNFGETTTNGILELRKEGFTARYIACVLYYGLAITDEKLKANDIEVIYVFTMMQLLDMAEKHGTHDIQLIESAREFLRDPIEWNNKRGFQKEEKGGTRA